MNLNHFDVIPHVPVTHILNFIPLNEVIKIDDVSKNLVSAQQHICASRRTLTIFIGSGTFENYNNLTNVDNHLPRKIMIMGPDGISRTVGVYGPLNSNSGESNSLMMRTLTAESVNLVTALFTNVEALELIVDRIDVDDIDFLNMMLVAWGPRLQVLSFWFGYLKCTDQCPSIMKHKNRKFGELFACINAHMFALRRLVFDNTTVTWHVNLDLPVLARLHEFTFKSPGNPLDILVRSLYLYAAGNVNLRMAIGSEIHGPTCLANLAQLSMGLSTQITYLSMNAHTFPSYHYLIQYIREFPNLRSLKIKAQTMTLAILGECLQSLRQLEYVHLIMLSGSYLMNGILHDLHGNARFPVPSVRMFMLTMSEPVEGAVQLQGDVLQLEAIFPNVQQVRI